MEIEQFQKRFGTVAIEKRFINIDQLCEALKIQVTEDVKNGEHRLIGTILYEQGLLTFSQLDEVLEEMRTVTPI